MIHLAKYGNIRFRVSITVQYVTSHCHMLAGHKFVVKVCVPEGAETATVTTTFNNVEDAVRQFGAVLKRYESSVIYDAVSSSLIAQYRGQTTHLIEQHLHLLTQEERDQLASDEAPLEAFDDVLRDGAIVVNK